MNSMSLFSRIHIQRYKQAVNVLAKYGFNEIQAFRSLKNTPFIGRLAPKPHVLDNLSRFEKARLAIEELGGAFIKVGQILSNRPDLLPPELILELEKLQDKVTPFPTEEAIALIETELEKKMEDMFLMFDEDVLASGSVSQVYRAVLLDGTPVVLKILRPGIETQFKVDLDVLSYISQHLGKIPRLKSQFENQNPVKELRVEIEKELDFSIEAVNLRRFSDNFRDDPRIFVPKTYPEFCSTKVLTMSYVQGIKVTDIQKLKQAKYNLPQVTDNLVDLGLEQIFEHRFFHADPHPGNILVMRNNQIAYLDFGLMGRLTQKQRQDLTDLVAAFSQKDARKISRMIIKNVAPRTHIDVNQLESDVDKLLDQYFDRSLKEINIGKLLSSVMTLIYTYHITLSSNVFLLIKAAISYEGIGRKLVPEFEISERAKVYAQRLLRERLSPQNIIKDLTLSSGEALTLLRDFPKEVRNLLYLLQSGGFQVNAEVVNLQHYLDQVMGRIDKITNRIAYAMVLAAMILGSAIALRASIGGEVAGIPLFAAVGFVVSGIMGFILLVSILRRGAL
jgi:ubiquinone biosynthesis protein